MTRVDRNTIFLMFALTESAKAIRAFDEVKRLAAIREYRSPTSERREYQSIFDSLRLALHFTGSVSRVFWPPRQKKSSVASARAAELRQLIGITDDHPLHQRRLRDHIEHLDERLDKWTTEPTRPFLAVEMVIHADDRLDVAEIAGATAIVYYEATNTVSILGESFDLDDLRTRVLEVQNAISSRLGA